MSRVFRLPLFALLASLTFVFVMMPSPAAAADVSCAGGQSGHFTIFSPVYGWPPPANEYCQVGNQATEYDCAWNGYEYVPTNVVSHPPVFCWSYTPYQHMICCGGH